MKLDKFIFKNSDIMKIKEYKKAVLSSIALLYKVVWIFMSSPLLAALDWRLRQTLYIQHWLYVLPSLPSNHALPHWTQLWFGQNWPGYLC